MAPGMLRIATAMLALAGAAAVRADPGYYLVTPYDEAGQVKLELRYWTVQNRGGRRVDWPEFGIGYGVTPRWTTAVLPSYIRTLGTTATRLSSLNWQNDVMLTQGQYDVDLALHTLLVHNQSPGSANAFEFGPALQIGLQGFAELGDWNNPPPSRRQSTRLGPVLAGNLALGRGENLYYQVAVLNGRIYNRPGRMMTARLVYSF